MEGPLQLVYLAVQIGIVAWCIRSESLNPPAHQNYLAAFGAGVFLALLATAAIHWSIVGVKRLAVVLGRRRASRVEVIPPASAGRLEKGSRHGAPQRYGRRNHP